MQELMMSPKTKMAEYIELEEALDALLYAMCGTGYQSDAMTAIRMIPTIDVVRCGNCRFIIDREDGSHGCYRHFMDNCKLDDFCSCGEET